MYTMYNTIDPYKNIHIKNTNKILGLLIIFIM